jgi:hypothetical protein
MATSVQPVSQGVLFKIQWNERQIAGERDV